MRLTQFLDRTKRACHGLSCELHNRSHWVRKLFGRRGWCSVWARSLSGLARAGRLGIGTGPCDRSPRSANEEAGRKHTDARYQAQTRGIDDSPSHQQVRSSVGYRRPLSHSMAASYQELAIKFLYWWLAAKQCCKVTTKTTVWGALPACPQICQLLVSVPRIRARTGPQ